ncbi:hypothetical protein FA13DRAFT_1789482 [Coprinellus micaceus]|uniref:Uncharacterized protein n=1 Tax=Coprinellus micaceus TaxID=71717 RepID=A0A4Y7TLH7_COPMI|nr:hypothetical protein FA13DRAFT_1789482 [Coprinellus micaceus]
MTEVSAAASNPEAPSTTASRRHRFGFSEVANLFIRLRRHQSRHPLHPRRERRLRTQLPRHKKRLLPPTPTMFRPFPGPIPSTPQDDLSLLHPSTPHEAASAGSQGNLPSIRESTLAEGPHIPITYNDVFEVAGGVSTSTLLRLTKQTILETIERRGLGANALADEQWECIICGPKKQAYKVQINYSATAVWCTRPDVCKPVALDRAQSFPGLMSITKRNAL